MKNTNDYGSVFKLGGNRRRHGVTQQTESGDLPDCLSGTGRTAGIGLYCGGFLQRQFTPLMTKLGMTHLQHDCRHTAATKLDNVGANTTIVKRHCFT